MQTDAPKLNGPSAATALGAIGVVSRGRRLRPAHAASFTLQLVEAMRPVLSDIWLSTNVGECS